MQKGIVKWFNESRGYGFIKKASGGEIFVHHSAIQDEGFKVLFEGDVVQFEVVNTEKGPRADSVTVL